MSCSQALLDLIKKKVTSQQRFIYSPTLIFTHTWWVLIIGPGLKTNRHQYAMLYHMKHVFSQCNPSLYACKITNINHQENRCRSAPGLIGEDTNENKQWFGFSCYLNIPAGVTLTSFWRIWHTREEKACPTSAEGSSAWPR